MGGMNMRAPITDLPIIFDDVSIFAGAVTILDRITLTLSPGTPTVLIGPNGSIQNVVPSLSWNEVTGANYYDVWVQDLMTGQVLRGEWGFKGAVVSDYYAIDDLMNVHHIALDREQAARRALAASSGVWRGAGEKAGQFYRPAKSDHEDARWFSAVLQRADRGGGRVRIDCGE